MELFEEFLAVLDVSFDEGFELLEVVVEPAAQVIHKYAHTGYYGAHLPRGFVGFFKLILNLENLLLKRSTARSRNIFSALLIALRALHL